jgi:hypothetical protein
MHLFFIRMVRSPLEANAICTAVATAVSTFEVLSVVLERVVERYEAGGE